jgi:hypothetical protein
MEPKILHLAGDMMTIKKALMFRILVTALVVFGAWANTSLLFASGCTDCVTTDDGIKACAVDWGEYDRCRADTWGTQCQRDNTGRCEGGCIVGEDPGCLWIY